MTTQHRFNECDFCFAENTPAPYEVAVPRPSDPSDMCAVMSACDTCGKAQATGPQASGGCALFSEWTTAIENGELKGIFFYS